VNGVPGIDSQMLAEKLKSWGFTGYRATDGGQIEQTVSKHHYVADIIHSIQLALRDGIADIDDGGSYRKNKFKKAGFRKHFQSGVVLRLEKEKPKK
jgi:hypothetical protein